MSTNAIVGVPITYMFLWSHLVRMSTSAFSIAILLPDGLLMICDANVKEQWKRTTQDLQRGVILWDAKCTP